MLGTYGKDLQTPAYGALGFRFGFRSWTMGVVFRPQHLKCREPAAVYFVWWWCTQGRLHTSARFKFAQAVLGARHDKLGRPDPGVGSAVGTKSVFSHWGTRRIRH